MVDTLCAGIAKKADIFTEERRPPHHHLEAIMLWRVVASCNLNGTIGLHVMRGKIQHRRWSTADIRNLCPAGHKPFYQCCGKGWRGQPSVTSNDNG